MATMATMWSRRGPKVFISVLVLVLVLVMFDTASAGKTG